MYKTTWNNPVPQQLVTIVNKVNNAAIRRITNERGDLVYVVPSYTLPDDVVMNGGLYSAKEIEKGYKSLEGTPAPIGHPMDADGNYVTANSEDGIIYYQCGVFNKNVQRQQCDKYGHRVYVEKHIHVDTANQTERGRKLIEAIDTNQPIHTSTGVLVNRVYNSGVTANGKEYTWEATELVHDHDAILLNKDGAATPSDGVGMLVNSRLLKNIEIDGKQLSINSVEINQSFSDLQAEIQVKIQEQFGDKEKRLWVTDLGDDYVVFMNDDTSYLAKYTRDGDNVTVENELEEVRRKTIWERISSGVRSVLTSPFSGLNNSSEGDDMALKDMLKKRLGDKYEENMSDDDMMNAYDKMMKGNAADTTEGEQSQPNVEEIVNSAVKKAVSDALEANAQESQKAEKQEIADKLKANGVELGEDEVIALSVNSLNAMLDKSAPKATIGLNAGSYEQNHNDSEYFDTLPE